MRTQTQTQTQTPHSRKSRASKTLRNSPKTLLEDLFTEFTKHQTIVKLMHFQTKRFGGHKATDVYYAKFIENSDHFLEVAQGIYGKLVMKDFSISGKTYSDSDFSKHLDTFATYLYALDSRITDAALLNIRDELVAETHKLKYLYTFV